MVQLTSWNDYASIEGIKKCRLNTMSTTVLSSDLIRNEEEEEKESRIVYPRSRQVKAEGESRTQGLLYECFSLSLSIFDKFSSYFPLFGITHPFQELELLNHIVPHFLQQAECTVHTLCRIPCISPPTHSLPSQSFV